MKTLNYIECTDYFGRSVLLDWVDTCEYDSDGVLIPKTKPLKLLASGTDPKNPNLKHIVSINPKGLTKLTPFFNQIDLTDLMNNMIHNSIEGMLLLIVASVNDAPIFGLFKLQLQDIDPLYNILPSNTDFDAGTLEGTAGYTGVALSVYQHNLFGVIKTNNKDNHKYFSIKASGQRTSISFKPQPDYAENSYIFVPTLDREDINIAQSTIHEAYLIKDYA